MVLYQAFTIELVDPVAGALAVVTATVELAFGQGGPLPDTALPLQGVSATGCLAIIQQVELVAQQQAMAALFWQAVIALSGAGHFGLVGQQRQLRIDQAVMHGTQAVRAVSPAIPQVSRIGQPLPPAAAQAFGLAAFEGVGEFK